MRPIVPVYSIAKAYTAIAVLRSFHVEERVGGLLPGALAVPEAVRPLRLRDLLSHRSGLNDYAQWGDYRAAVAARETPWPQAEVLARAEVGSAGRFRYSNIGFLLLRLALEARYGGTYFDVLDRLVFAPLGICAHPFAEREDWGRCGHPSIDASLRAYHPAWVYPGTFAADPMEAARGLGLVMRGGLGQPLAAQLRKTSPVDVPPTHPMTPHAGYGLGVMTSGEPASVVAHGGQGPGFTLFAAASVDGSRWHGEAQGSEEEDLELVRRCVDGARG